MFSPHLASGNDFSAAMKGSADDTQPADAKLMQGIKTTEYIQKIETEIFMTY